MRTVRTVIVVLVLVAVSAVSRSSAQTFTYSYFSEYLNSYREEFAIPALSAAIVQNGTVVWHTGLGRQDVEANTPARSDTSYFVGNLSQIFGATLLLQKCLDENTLELGDEIVRWVPSYGDSSTTVGQLLTHRSPAGTYAYDPLRFAGLTAVVEECADLPYRHVLAGEIFNRLAMIGSVPGRAIEGVAMPGGAEFLPADLARYNAILGQMARHYRVDRGLPVRATVPTVPADAATGAITTVLDLAEFDKALRGPGLLSREALTLAWTQAGGSMPTGLGWFVHNYKNEPLVWQFDLTRDVASSIVVKLPARDLTFILLANSDGLTRLSGLSAGDPMTSPFIRLFLRFFAP